MDLPVRDESPARPDHPQEMRLATTASGEAGGLAASSAGAR